MTENFPGPMAGKTALVTGGTGGIGRATAAGLAALGARVGITGRDKARTQAAATGIVRESGNPAADAFVADMSCQAGIRALAVAVRSAYPRLDVLVNNMGGLWATRHLTADGLEHTFAVNHLAAFLLTGLVLDRLKGSAPARIVTVSSNAQAAGRLNFDDPQGERSYSGQRAYSQSKLTSRPDPVRRPGGGMTAHPNEKRLLSLSANTSPMRGMANSRAGSDTTRTGRSACSSRRTRPGCQPRIVGDPSAHRPSAQ